MPKNAVQRLQKIESDLKTVISIYNITNKFSNEHDKSKTSKDAAHLSQISTPKHLENTELLDKYQNLSSQSKPFQLYCWKKTSSFDAQSSQIIHSGESGMIKKKWEPKKPGSAPTSTSTLSTICVSDYIRQPTSESANTILENSIFSREETSDNLKNHNGFDSSNSEVYEVLMTPSKTLQTAYEILANNNFKENEDLTEDSETLSYKSVSCCRKKETEDDNSFEKHEVDHTFYVKTAQYLNRNSSLNYKKVKEQPENQNTVIERSRSVSPRKGSSRTSKLFTAAKFSAEPKKNKSPQESSPKYNTTPRKIPRLESLMSDNSNETTNAKVRSEIKDSQERTTKLGSNKIEKKDRSTKRESDNASNVSKYSKEVNLKSPGKSNVKTKQENFVINGWDEKKNIFEKERKVKFFGANSDCNNQQKLTKNLDQANQELWVNEFSKIIEISNEKLEKMKVSKELALEIAKQLKSKYDEIQQLKIELMEKMKKVEKDNERLSKEVVDVSESKMKLQSKIEGLKRDSRTKLMEQDVITKDILSENACLKSKICELQKQYNEELLKKQQEIDQVQKERQAEIRNETKSRENQEEDIQRLKNEKTELQSLLNERNSKIEILEEKIMELQEEAQKQKQNLKKKTDRLEETNKELEIIRQNSGGLEEQVKMLRKNIENFDEIQQNLLKQTTSYYQQIKSNEEEIIKLQKENVKLQEENSKLKTELENEKDALLIKIKIIEDQQETIKQLRDKSEETKTLLKKNQSLERVLNIEREEKLELQEAVERLKFRKDELKKKVKNLENDLLLAPQEVVRDLQKTQLVLHELENQVQIKQKEWELQLQSLLREKEQACSAAEFATKKLMQTTNEFQKQSQAHKKLHRVLAENLARKQKNLREANNKKNFTLTKQSLSHVCPDDKMSWLKDHYLNTTDEDSAIMEWYFRNPSCCCEDFKTKSSLHFP